VELDGVELGRGGTRRGDGGNADVVLLGQRGRGGDGVRVPAVAPHRRHAHDLAAAAPEVGIERNVDEWLGCCRGEVEPCGRNVGLLTVVPCRRPAVDQLDDEERRHQYDAHHVQYHQHLYHLHLETYKQLLVGKFEIRHTAKFTRALGGA